MTGYLTKRYLVDESFNLSDAAGKMTISRSYMETTADTMSLCEYSGQQSRHIYGFQRNHKENLIDTPVSKVTYESLIKKYALPIVECVSERRFIDGKLHIFSTYADVRVVDIRFSSQEEMLAYDAPYYFKHDVTDNPSYCDLGLWKSHTKSA